MHISDIGFPPQNRLFNQTLVYVVIDRKNRALLFNKQSFKFFKKIVALFPIKGYGYFIEKFVILPATPAGTIISVICSENAEKSKGVCVVSDP
jgi:hypothetical protein